MTTEVVIAAAIAVEAEAAKPSIAYRIGEQAYHLGIARGHNPFRVDCVYEWKQWRAGWDASQGKSTGNG